MALLTRLLQQRHNYYRALLVIEVLVLISLSSLQRAPRLVGVIYVVISGVAVLLDSPLLPGHRLQAGEVGNLSTRLRNQLQRIMVRRRLIAMAWVACVVMEVLWQGVLTVSPDLALQLCAPRLLLWLILLPYVLWSLVNALAEEPVFSGSVLMGAASGYLLVGFTGGIVLNTLMVLEPAAFDLPQTSGGLAAGLAHAPTVLGAAFGCLTTLGSPVLRLDHLSVLIASVGIAVVGQLYIAILIAGVLGKPRQLAAVRKAAVRRASARSRQGIKRVSRGRR
jgi:hypothetical protein